MNQPSTTGSLFQAIEKLHGERPWGSFLDAGTGTKSLEWIQTLDTREWTAITASRSMASQVQESLARPMRDGDRLLVGNWVEESLLTGEQFDTVLMDYLLGAVEGFAPYWQDRLFHRMRPLVGGRLYFIGLEPYVPFPASTEEGSVICRIGRLRDSCLLLAGERPYREYPMDWVLRHMGQAGFRMIDARRYPIIFGERFINQQLDMCLNRLERFGDPALAESMRAHVEQLRETALDMAREKGGLRHGADYVIAAEPMEPFGS